MKSTKKKPIRVTVIHPADLGRFRPGGMHGAPRWFKDGEGDPPPTDWRSGLPDDLKSAPALKDVKDIAGLAKRYVDTAAHLGNALRIPSENAGEADRTEFREKLKKHVPGLAELPKKPEEREAWLRDQGWTPKEAKEYVVDEALGLPADAAEALRAEALEEGLTPGQFRARAKRASAALEQRREADKAREKELRDEYGATLDDRLKEAAVVAEKTGAPKAIRDAIAKRQVDKVTLGYFAGLAKSLGLEGREIAEQRGGRPAAMTKDQAIAEQQEILRNPALWNGSSPEQPRLQKRMAELQAFIDPELASAQE